MRIVADRADRMDNRNNPTLGRLVFGMRLGARGVEPAVCEGGITGMVLAIPAGPATYPGATKRRITAGILRNFSG